MTIFLLIFITLESMDVSRPAQTQTSMASTEHEDVHKAVVDGPNLKSSVTEGNTLNTYRKSILLFFIFQYNHRLCILIYNIIYILYITSII